MTTASIAQHVQDVQLALGSIDLQMVERVADALYDAFSRHRRVFLFGNGASAALASHMAGDLGKNTAAGLGQGPAAPAGPRLRVISLSDNVAWMTALGNDLSYEDMFLEQLKNHLDPDDVVIGISGSGGSTNVLRALQYARTHGATTVLMTGTQPQAELARPFVTLLLQAPSADIDTIEAVHVALHHALTRAVASRAAQAAHT